MQQIGRFAPSPSGRMHLGNVFSAMLAWLSIRSCGGRLVLRIEDLDPDRCRPEYADTLKRDLEWLGLTWDTEQTPQSRRSEAYREMFSRLEERGLIYPCYCSRTELHAASAPHASDGTVLYAGTCRNLTPDERAAKTKAPCWRVRAPDEDVSFTDGVQGEYTQNLAHGCGDFILRRADGVYAYQLAVVTDDAEAGVTQVVEAATFFPPRRGRSGSSGSSAFRSRTTIMCRCSSRRTEDGFPSASGIWTWARCASGIRRRRFWGCSHTRAGFFLTAKRFARTSLQEYFHGGWCEKRILLSQIRKNRANRVCKIAECVL